MTRTFRPALLLPFAVLVVPALPGCSTNPATGRSHLMLLSRDEEIRIGEESAPQFTAEYGGAVADDRLQRYITDLGRKLAARTEADYPQLDWQFTLLDSNVVNAFALPGGKVFVTRGLASRLDNEAQMAGVLGHEIGHVTAQHANRRISKQIGFNISIAALGVVVGTADEDSSLHEYGRYAVPAIAIGGNVILLGYGRDEEIEADRLGMRYMSRAGYKPSAQLGVMHVLAGLSRPGGRPPEWLSTHPLPETRIEEIEHLLATRYQAEEASPSYTINRERYQADFLAPLSKLPRSRHPAEGEAVGQTRDHASWCALCAGALVSR